MCILNAYKPARLEWVLPVLECYVKFTLTLLVYCLNQLLKNVKYFLQISTEMFFSSSEFHQPFLLCEGGSFKAIRFVRSSNPFEILDYQPFASLALILVW